MTITLTREEAQQVLGALNEGLTSKEYRALVETLRTRLAQQACNRCGKVNPAEIHTCTPKQGAFFTEENGFPETFVPKDGKTEAIRSLTDQCAELIWERDELRKQVWRYEHTCTPLDPLLEALRVPDYSKAGFAPPQREWRGLTDEEVDEAARERWVAKQSFEAGAWWANEKLREKNV